MTIYEIDPLHDSRWGALVESHPNSSIFHTCEWLNALHRTYRYTPRAFTTNPPATPLSNGIVFCHINSFLTGSRLVSLPFSDHCDPLVASSDDFKALFSAALKNANSKINYAEVRPRSVPIDPDSNLKTWSRYHLHILDLRPSLEDLYSGLHNSGMQRKVRRADREHVVIDFGRAEPLLQDFYALLLLTRRRHGVPPQPLSWFRNLIESCGGRATIYVARLGQRPIASIFTLRHKSSLVYKYGASDSRFHNVGAMPRLFWEAIQQAKSMGLTELDLGRSDQNNEGLIRFKNHLAAAKTSLQYWRSSVAATGETRKRLERVAQHFLIRLPDGLFRLAGQFLYRHTG